MIEDSSGKNRLNLKQLAIDIVEGKVFGSWMLKDPKDIGMVFLPLIFAASKDFEGVDIVSVYEYYDKALPRGVNGYPCFASANFLSSKQVEEIQPLIDQYQNMKNTFIGGNKDVANDE